MISGRNSRAPANSPEPGRHQKTASAPQAAARFPRPGLVHQRDRIVLCVDRCRSRSKIQTVDDRQQEQREQRRKRHRECLAVGQWIEQPRFAIFEEEHRKKRRKNDQQRKRQRLRDQCVIE